MSVLRASRLAIPRIPLQHAVRQRRTFLAPTSALRADLVQDLYLKELKNYKPATLSPNDADAHVQKFAMPKAPLSPEESDIAKDLKSYEEQPVEVEGQVEQAQVVDEGNWFEEDEPEEEHAAH